MKNVLLVFLMPFMMVNLAHSQTLLLLPDTKGSEIAITNVSLHGASILLKTPTKPNEFRRQSFGAANIALNKQDNYTSFRGDIRYGIGKEKRKNIVQSLDAIYGPQYGLGISTFYQKNALVINNPTVENTTLTFTPSFGYLVGFIYHINDKFYVGIETTPYISASIRYNKITSKNATADLNGLDIGGTSYLNFTAGFKLK